MTRENKKIIKGKKGGPAQRKEEGFYDQNNPILPLEKKMNVYYKQMAQEQKKESALFPLSL